MNTNSGQCPEDEAVNDPKDCSSEFGMAQRTKVFRSLSEELRMLTAGTPQTPSEILIREDRASGQGSP